MYFPCYSFVNITSNRERKVNTFNSLVIVLILNEFIFYTESQVLKFQLFTLFYNGLLYIFFDIRMRTHSKPVCFTLIVGKHTMLTRRSLIVPLQGKQQKTANIKKR